MANHPYEFGPINGEFSGFSPIFADVPGLGTGEIMTTRVEDGYVTFFVEDQVDPQILHPLQMAQVDALGLVACQIDGQQHQADQIDISRYEALYPDEFR